MTSKNHRTNKASESWFLFIVFGLVACCLYGVGAGFRGDVGILVLPLAEQCSLTYEDVSFCVAVMQLVFGASQPLLGVWASRTSNRFILIVGVVFFIASLIGMGFARDFLSLFVSLGIFFGVGAGAVSFGLVLTSAINFVGQERAMMISGMLNAAAGMGAFALSPILASLVQIGGMGAVMAGMVVPLAALIPIACIVTSKDKNSPAAQISDEPPYAISLSTLCGRMMHNRTFVLLMVGFSTCGFHMVIIESHLFSQYLSYGIEESVASWVFSLYGVFTISGALLSGWLSTRISKSALLSFYYGFRAVWVLAYIFLVPKNVVTAILFSAGLGMTGDATVSPTSGLVSREFAFSEVASLIGVLFFCHQIGAFLSAWLGGVLFSLTGGYEILWVLDAGLCLIACVASKAISSQAPSSSRS